MADATRLMPLIRTGLFISFDVLDEKQAVRNHSQSLARLAERGGLSPCEALAIAEKRAWSRWPYEDALKALAALASGTTATKEPKT